MRALKMLSFVLAFMTLMAGAMAAFEVSELRYGSASQERAQDVVASLTFTNKEAGKNIQNISLAFVGNAKYQISPTSELVNLAMDDSASLSVPAYVPLDLDAVDSNGKPIAVNIGTATVTVRYSDSTTESKTMSVYMQAENKLEFNSDSTIAIGDQDAVRLRDNKEYDGVRRDDKITLSVVLENKFSGSGDCDEEGEDCDIEDIELELSPENSDFDDDSTDFNDMRSGDEDTETLSFDIPDDVDDDDYDFELFVVGTDENGARHGDHLEFTLTVEVPRDEVLISSATVSPSELSCLARKASLRVSIENTGTDDQDRAAILIDSPRLDLKQSIYNIVLDEGDLETKTFDLILPNDVEPGVYYITVIANYDNTKESDRQSATLVIKECVTEPVDDEEDVTPDEDEDDSNVEVITIPPTTGLVIGEDKEKDSFLNSEAYVLLLAGVFIVALLMFFILIVLLLKR
jgi:hypothetical protein